MCSPCICSQAPGAASKVGSGGGAAALPTVGRRLLLLCSNATAVRTQLLSRLFRSWAGVLAAGGSPKEGQAAATECAAELERVEHSLVMAYIDRKQVQCRCWLCCGGGVRAEWAARLGQCQATWGRPLTTDPR